MLTSISREQRVINVGKESRVGQLNISLRVVDPLLVGIILWPEHGAIVDRMRIALNWEGAYLDQGNVVIGGDDRAIRKLQWVNTPPMYVTAELRSKSVVAVTFSEAVKASDFKAGVTVRVDGKPVVVTGALRDGRPNVVRYILRTSPDIGDKITWAYDAGNGRIRNWDGERLRPVSEKRVAIVAP
jgi:hypothetical protein